MSGYSYRFGKPREQVHYERYGSRDVPVRRGLGGNPGNPVGNPKLSVNWVAVISGLAAILSGIVMIYEGTRSR